MTDPPPLIWASTKPGEDHVHIFAIFTHTWLTRDAAHVAELVAVVRATGIGCRVESNGSEGA